jgi:Concanavalin A-like lectin/glucanases superfamily
MSVKDAILNTQPMGYWPLDDLDGLSCHDEMGHHDALAPAQGVTLAVLPFGETQAPYFDGALGSFLTIDDDPRYSQPYANSLTVAAWICPLALDNANTAGTDDQYVHFVEKAVGPSSDAEWALRLYNQTNPARHSRLSFYTFNLGSPTGKGNGSYMEYGVSSNDETPIELGKWVFVLGEAEPWISPTDETMGCILWKQAVEAKRVAADKYFGYKVHPQHGAGQIRVGGTQTTGFKGAIAHLAVWNSQLSPAKIASIWTAGASDLRDTAMYHSYV